MFIKIITQYQVDVAGKAKMLEVISEGDPKKNIDFVLFVDEHLKMVNKKIDLTIIGAFMSGRAIESAVYCFKEDDHDCHASPADGCAHPSHNQLPQ